MNEQYEAVFLSSGSQLSLSLFSGERKKKKKKEEDASGHIALFLGLCSFLLFLCKLILETLSNLFKIPVSFHKTSTINASLSGM